MRKKRGLFLAIIAIYSFVILPIISSLTVYAEERFVLTGVSTKGNENLIPPDPPLIKGGSSNFPLLIKGRREGFSEESPVIRVAERTDPIDRIAPAIIHNPPEGKHSKGQDIRISATITDNDRVTKATLYYKEEGQTGYIPLEMVRKEGDQYLATIPGDAARGGKVEYYIEAMDRGENITLRGLSIMPLVVQLSEEESSQIMVAEGQEKEKITKPWYKKWWVWTIAAVIVGGAGGMAAAAGGGGSDSGGSNGGGGEDTGKVTVKW